MSAKIDAALALGKALTEYIKLDVETGSPMPDALENAYCFVCGFVEINGLSEKRMHESLSFCVEQMREQRRNS